MRKLIPDETLLTDIIGAVKRQTVTEQWMCSNGKYLLAGYE